MSDDEFYYDDDDWYWYEEDTVGIGDELAETTVHSPIMVEDPSLEVVDTYSDWEYYSDDYYDDDPTIAKEQKANGEVEPRRKKRKISSGHSIGSSVVNSSTPMVNSFKGVLWKVPMKKSDEEIELYEPGKGERVALLSDWREVFKAPIYRNNWFSNRSKANKHELRDYDKQNDNEQDDGTVYAASIDSPEYEASMVAKRVRYSPPPLEIENMEKIIDRQRGKLSQVEPEDLPSHPLAEMMVVADSDEELEEVASSTVVGDAPDDEEQPPSDKSIRVEIPTLAAAMKEDLSNKDTQRKRGRKPKNSPTEIKPAPSDRNKREDGSNLKQEAVSRPTHATKKRKKSSEVEVEEEQPAQKQNENDNSTGRRSKRTVSSAKRRKV